MKTLYDCLSHVGQTPNNRLTSRQSMISCVLWLLIVASLLIGQTSAQQSPIAGQAVEGELVLRCNDCGSSDHQGPKNSWLISDPRTLKVTMLDVGKLKGIKLKPGQRVKLSGKFQPPIPTQAKMASKVFEVESLEPMSGSLEEGATAEASPSETPAVESSAPAEAESAASVTTADLSCLLIFANSPVTTVESTLIAKVENMMFNDTDNISKAVEANSLGHYSLSHGRTELVTVNVTPSTTSLVDMENAMFDALPAGVNPNDYGRVLLFLPAGSNLGTAVGDVGGTKTVYSYAWTGTTFDGLLHELGHNFGFLHASTVSDEYGDTTCAMGVSYANKGNVTSSYNAVKLSQNGWLDPFPGTQQSIISDVTYDLHPISAHPDTTAGMRILKIAGNEDHFISYRRRLLPYGWLRNNSEVDKINIHRAAPSDYFYYKNAGYYDNSYRISSLTPTLTYNIGSTTVTFERFGPGNQYATVSIDFDDGNDKPVANEQTIAIPVNTYTPITLSASDGDDPLSALSYELVTNPTNGIILGTAPNLIYIPNVNFIGADSLVFKVNDGDISSFATVTINVTGIANPSGNSLPIFASNPIDGGSVNEDSPYNATLSDHATDSNSADTLTYEKMSGPSWLIVAEDGTLSGTPLNDDVGSNSFIVTVTDGQSNRVATTLNITVINTNDDPAFTSNPIVGNNATQDVAYSGTLADYATDDDAGASLSYSLAGAQSWLSVASDGSLSGTPSIDDLGLNSFTVNVSDNNGGSDSATLEILVRAPNNVPIVDAGPDQTFVIDDLGWSPALLNPQAWYDASDTSSITSSGGFISQWNDKSGNNRHATQSMSLAKPTTGTATMGGLNTISLNGNNQYLNLDLDYLAGVSHTAFIVTKTTHYGNIYGAANRDAGSNSLHVGFNGQSLYRMNYWGNDWAQSISSNFKPSTGNLLNFIWKSGTTKQVYANGSSEGTSEGSGASTGIIGTMSGGGRIANTTGHGLYGGDIAEIIFITGDISEENRLRMEGYLANKWGLNAYLPQSHPYKSSGPSKLMAALDGNVSDQDNEDFTTTWSLVSGPNGVIIENPSATDTAVTIDTFGTYTLQLSAVDERSGQGTDQMTITITSEGQSNRSPIWSSNLGSGAAATEDTAFSNTLAGDATDPENDSLTYAKHIGPAWLNVSTNGGLSGTPSNDDVGSNEFFVSVTDGNSSPVLARLTIEVNNTNDSPTFISDPIDGGSVIAGYLYNSTIAGSTIDPDLNDSLSYALVSPQGWLSINPTGTLSGTPGQGDIGLNSFSISVSDGNGGSDTATLNINVLENTNSSPIANAGPDQTVYLGPTLWTPASINTVAWFDANDAATITQSEGKVSQWRDKSGNGRHAVQATGTRQPTYQANDTLANGMPSIGDPALSGSIGMDTPQFSAKNIYVVVYYKDGLDTAFVGYPTLLSGPESNGRYRIMGSQGSADFIGSSNFNDAGTYKNGSTSNTLSALSMPVSLFKFKASSARDQVYALGYNQLYSDRDWQGAYCEWIFTDGTEDEATEKKIEGYLAHKWGLADKLTGHTYENQAPAANVVTVNLNGSTTDPDNDDLITTWAVDSGAGPVTFGDGSAATTTATFSALGTYVLKLTVHDGFSSGEDTVTIHVVESIPYDDWASGTFTNPFTATGLTGNPDGDQLTNLQEYAFGLDPTSPINQPLSYVAGGALNQTGLPILANDGSRYHAVFTRRKDHVAVGLTYTVQFSADLSQWTASSSAPIRQTSVTDTGDYEAASVPYPDTVPVTGGGTEEVPKFFRVGVASN